MDFISFIKDDHHITISVDNIVSFQDDETGRTRIALTNQEFVYTQTPMSDKLKKWLRLKGHDIINLENVK